MHSICVAARLTGPLLAPTRLPARLSRPAQTSTVGVLLAHGNQAQTWKGKLLNGLATALAQKGERYVSCPGSLGGRWAGLASALARNGEQASPLPRRSPPVESRRAVASSRRHAASSCTDDASAARVQPRLNHTLLDSSRRSKRRRRQPDPHKAQHALSTPCNLARAGHLVVRYYCNGKEQRRLRLLEKVLDAATTSPYARGVTRWVLGGIGERLGPSSLCPAVSLCLSL